MKFNFDEWKNKKVVMHCKTLEEAEDFCHEMQKAGMERNNGSSYGKDSYFKNIGSSMCYWFNLGLCGSKEFFESKGFIVLEWGDYMNRETNR